MRNCGRHLVLVALSSMVLAACGGGDSEGTGGMGNLPPIIQGTPVTTLTAGSSYSFTPSAADPDGDPLTFAASGLPNWITFNASTGAMTGTPSEANVGMTGMITIAVSDSRAQTELPAFRINVVSGATTPPPGGNAAPTIAGTPGTTATVGQAYSFMPTGDDADDDTLTFSIQNRPTWATFTPATGQLSGTPTASDVGTTSGIVISVTDGAVTASLPAFNLTVQTTPPANRAPTISGTPATSVLAGVAYSFRPVASDPDGNTLRFSIQGQPSWATFSTTTGRLSGTPAIANVGTFSNIRISVTDGTATTNLTAFNIQVTAPANRAPVISGTPVGQVSVGVAYSFQPSASDADGNPLTFRIENMPSWAQFNTTNGRLSGTPAAGNVGTFSNIMISVSDGTASTSLSSFSITVVQTGSGTAVVSWAAPTSNTDGTALTDLAGFRVVYGRAQNTLDQAVEVNNPGLTSYTVTDLASGQWYFAVYAVNQRGIASDLSNVATKTIP